MRTKYNELNNNQKGELNKISLTVIILREQKLCVLDFFFLKNVSHESAWLPMMMGLIRSITSRYDSPPTPG